MRIPLLVALATILLAGAAVVVGNPWFTAYIEGDDFRTFISKQTSKGLKVPGEYEQVHRLGPWTASATAYHGKSSDHIIQILQARDIKARFNPWGIFMNRWQLDWLTIREGSVTLQKTEGASKEPAEPDKPWYSELLPDEFFLARTYVESADVFWRFRGRPCGIRDMKVIIRPNGKDFEYWGDGGRLHFPPAPDFSVRHLHTLVRKPRVHLYEARLGPSKRGERGSLVIRGEAGLQEDRTILAKIDFEDLPLTPWLPARWRERTHGYATGELHWKSNGTKIEGSTGRGKIDIGQARLHNTPMLEQVAELTKNMAFRDMRFDRMTMQVHWRHPRLRLKNIRIEAKDLMRIEGSITVQRRALSGQLRLGVKPESLSEFPGADAHIFNVRKDGYLWAKIRLSGTIDQPKQDLTQRFEDLMWTSPAAFFRMLFIGLGGEPPNAFGEE